MDTKIIQKKNNILSEEEAQEFKHLMKQMCDIELTDEEALEQGGRLVLLLELICKLNTKEDSVIPSGKMVQND